MTKIDMEEKGLLNGGNTIAADDLATQGATTGWYCDWFSVNNKLIPL